MADGPMTEAEAEDLLRGFADSKQNVHVFLNNVVKTHDTTRVGNLTSDELGRSVLPVRTYKELALFCNDVAGMDYFGDYFEKMSQIQTGTSLSKDALLVKLAVTQKRELADLTPGEKKRNKSWFKSKDEKKEEGEAV